MRSKTLFKIPILTAAIGLLSIPSIPVSAKVMTDRGRYAWSIAELDKVYYEFEAEKDVICGKDLECRMELPYLRSETDPIYRALEAYSMSSFVLSAINPSTNTFRARFRDIDAMAMEMEGVERHNPLTEAYVAWLDSSYQEPDYTFIDYMRDGYYPAGLHPIYRATTALNGPNWFPVETEVEISVPDAHLELNDRHIIMLYGVNEPSSVLSWVDYNSCLNSPSYHPGMECRLMYDESANYLYVPFEVDDPTGIIEDEQGTTPTIPGETDPDFPTTPPDDPDLPISPSADTEEPDITSVIPSEDVNTLTDTESTNASMPNHILESPTITYAIVTRYQETAPAASVSEVAYTTTTVRSVAPQGSQQKDDSTSASDQTTVATTSTFSSSPDRTVEIPLAAGSESQPSASFPWWLLIVTVIAGLCGIFWWLILPLFRRSNDKEG